MPCNVQLFSTALKLSVQLRSSPAQPARNPSTIRPSGSTISQFAQPQRCCRSRTSAVASEGVGSPGQQQQYLRVQYAAAAAATASAATANLHRVQPASSPSTGVGSSNNTNGQAQQSSVTGSANFSDRTTSSSNSSSNNAGSTVSKAACLQAHSALRQQGADTPAGQQEPQQQQHQYHRRQRQHHQQQHSTSPSDSHGVQVVLQQGPLLQQQQQEQQQQGDAQQHAAERQPQHHQQQHQQQVADEDLLQQLRPLLQPPNQHQQQQQQQQRHQQLSRALLPQPLQPGSAVFDPSALSISERVRLLASTAAARRRNSTRSWPRHRPTGPPVDVLQCCAAAGLSPSASRYVLDHVRGRKISTAPEVLLPLLESYKRLADAYGDAVVISWLRKAPSVIRAEDEVADRLSQLLVFLGPEATLPDVLALTKRCPQVLQVSRTLLVQRLQLLCSMLGRDLVTEGGTLLLAAPALLAMHPLTLEVKLQHLRALANTHPSWSEAYGSCPSKTLAVLLTYSLERQLRLHYIAAHALQEKIQMNTVMAWSKRDWLKAHPDFDAWCHNYKRLQQAQQKLAAQAPASHPL